MASFVQRNWSLIFFAGFILVMYLRRRGGMGGGMGGCGGGHSGQQDTSSADQLGPESDSRTGVDETSGRPAEAGEPDQALISPAHPRR